VGPKHSAWVRPGASPVGPLGQVRPTSELVVRGGCKQTSITSSKELQNILIKLSKLVRDHGGNAISYDKSGAEIRFWFLRLEDRIYAAGKRGNERTGTAPGAAVAVPVSG